MAKQYGDVVTFGMGGQHMYFINDPDLIRDVMVTHNSNFIKGRALERAKRLLGQGLLTSEGELHRRQRRLVQPAFHRQRIAAYAQVMVEHAARLSNKWKHGIGVDMSHEMTRLTLGIVAKTLFDSEVESEADEIGEAMTCIMQMFNLLMYPFAELIEKLRFRRCGATSGCVRGWIPSFIELSTRGGAAEKIAAICYRFCCLPRTRKTGAVECPISRFAMKR